MSLFFAKKGEHAEPDIFIVPILSFPRRHLVRTWFWFTNSHTCLGGSCAHPIGINGVVKCRTTRPLLPPRPIGRTAPFARCHEPGYRGLRPVFQL
jgi:hypothetical protein